MTEQADKAVEGVVRQIASQLAESDAKPLSQIKEIVIALGEQQALGLLKQTLDTEERGGIPVPDGSRRRTPGGVFFYLARKVLSREDKQRIFPNKKPAQAAKPATSPPAEKPQVERRPRPRPRIIDVAAERASGSGGRSSFRPPELDNALSRARVKKKVQHALEPLAPAAQYNILLDILAELHDQLQSEGPASTTQPSSSR